MKKAKRPSRDGIVKRLRRAEGHLHSVSALLASDRSSYDLAQQLRAVEAAICAAKRQLIHDHLQHRLGQGEASSLALLEIKRLVKLL